MRWCVDTVSKNQSRGLLSVHFQASKRESPSSEQTLASLLALYGLHKELIRWNPKMLGFLGSRWGFRLRVLVIEGCLGFGALGFRVWGVSCRHLPKVFSLPSEGHQNSAAECPAGG